MPPIRYLDSGGIPPRFKRRYTPGSPVPLSVLEAMEQNPEAPWEIRDRMLSGLRAAAISGETLAGAAPDERGVPYAQWKARELNRIFAQHGTGGAGRITAAAVEDGLEKEANREPTKTQPARLNRQQLKAEGWSEAHDEDLPLEDRCEGLLKVIEVHYHYSVESWEIARRVRWTMGAHGDFDEFAASWLWANGSRNDSPFEGLEPVVEALRREYPAPEKPMIGAGRTYWGTGDDHRYRGPHNSPPKKGAVDD
jgi:hypothetical protein